MTSDEIRDEGMRASPCRGNENEKQYPVKSPGIAVELTPTEKRRNLFLSRDSVPRCFANIFRASTRHGPDKFLCDLPLFSPPGARYLHPEICSVDMLGLSCTGMRKSLLQFHAWGRLTCVNCGILCARAKLYIYNPEASISCYYFVTQRRLMLARAV